MAALWQRYYVWKAAKEKALQSQSSSTNTITRAAAGSRRAYQTSSSVVSFLKPTYRPRLRTRHAYHSYNHQSAQPRRLEAEKKTVHVTVS